MELKGKEMQYLTTLIQNLQEIKKKFSKKSSKDLIVDETIIDTPKKKVLSRRNSKRKSSKSKKTIVYENTELNENKINAQNSVYNNNEENNIK